MQSIETKISSIPASNESLITPTGQRFMQIQAIPVENGSLQLPKNPPIYYSSFNQPPIFVSAGGETIERAQQRVRWQMVYLLKGISMSEDGRFHPSNAEKQIKILSLFINLLID